MAHDKDKEKLVKIGTEYREQLATIAAHQKRTMRATLEVMIANKYREIQSEGEGGTTDADS